MLFRSERFAVAGVLASRINGFNDWLRDEQVVATNAAPLYQVPDAGPVPMPRIPGIAAPAPDDPRARHPGIGEDGAAVLREAGLAEAEIDALSGAGVLHGVRPPGAVSS